MCLFWYVLSMCLWLLPDYLSRLVSHDIRLCDNRLRIDMLSKGGPMDSTYPRELASYVNKIGISTYGRVAEVGA